MKKTYIYVNGELVEKGSKEHYESLGPMVIPDIEPYKSMIDGSMITSRSVHRDTYDSMAASKLATKRWKPSCHHQLTLDEKSCGSNWAT